jgi:hypothetical protein
MIRRAAEGKRQAEGRERRQETVEERRVFDREQAREEAAPMRIDLERRLQAREIAVGQREGGVGLAKLLRVRQVLGIVDGHVVAAREVHREGERFRLRPWFPGGNRHDLVGRAGEGP